jgi:hypothetical protein
MTGFFPVDSSQLPVLSGRKRSEIIGKNPKKFPAGTLLPRNHGNYPESAVSGPGCSIWLYTNIILRIFRICYNYNTYNKF